MLSSRLELAGSTYAVPVAIKPDPVGTEIDTVRA
jgi:hypothetical protein